MTLLAAFSVGVCFHFHSSIKVHIVLPIMSSESSDDLVVCSQDSNANVTSSSENAPILEFAGMCLLDNGGLPRSRPQEDSDFTSDSEATKGKRKHSKKPKTEVQPIKLKRNEKMECQEVDSESQLQSETSDMSEDWEADNEEEEEPVIVEESDEECDGACIHEPEMFVMDVQPNVEAPSATSLTQPFTSGMKRKTHDKLVSPRVPKLKKSSANLE